MDKLSISSGFFDLNIQFEKNTIKKTLAVAQQLGYKVVAINTHLEESVFEPKKKKKKGEPREVSDIVPVPLVLDDIIDKVPGGIHILRRLTVEISDTLHAHKLMQSENFKKYDMIAVIPNSQSALQYLCSTMDVDIIAVDSSNRSLRLTRKIYTMAVDRGLYFELTYSPAINDSTARKNIISMSHVYHAVGKSQNVFVSSGAATPYDLRGPYDVINLCLILGMNEEKAKSAICEGCRSLYIRSVGRRCGKAVVLVSKIPSSDEDSSFEDDDILEIASLKSYGLTSSYTEQASNNLALAIDSNSDLPSSSSALKESDNFGDLSQNNMELSLKSLKNEENNHNSKSPKRFKADSQSMSVDHNS